MLGNTERAIKYGQSRETGNTLLTIRKKTQHNTYRTSLHANNRKQHWHLNKKENCCLLIAYAIIVFCLLIHINIKYTHSIPFHEKNKSRTLSMLICISSVSYNLLTPVLCLETNRYYNTEP